MSTLITICLCGVALLGGWYLWRLSRRRAIRAEPFPPEWTAFLESNVKLFRKLPAELKRELEGHV
ncbi:MAG: hypothetical protein KDD44_07775, partial [Bdellovibrionales bacterium]|nr:hypothetical protein [Bdellovibrionales bacterium]